MPTIRSKKEKRALRACDWCRAKKKRCTISSTSVKRLCVECECNGQICVFSHRHSSEITADVCIKQERDLLARGIRALFNTARENDCLRENPSRKAANRSPSLAYILEVLNVESDPLSCRIRKVKGKRQSADPRANSVPTQSLTTETVQAPAHTQPFLTGHPAEETSYLRDQPENTHAAMNHPDSSAHLSFVTGDRRNSEIPIADQQEQEEALISMHPERSRVADLDASTICHVEYTAIDDAGSSRTNDLDHSLYSRVNESSANNHLQPSFTNHPVFPSFPEVEFSFQQEISEAYPGTLEMIDVGRFEAQVVGSLEGNIASFPSSNFRTSHNESINPHWFHEWDDSLDIHTGV